MAHRKQLRRSGQRGIVRPTDSIPNHRRRMERIGTDRQIAGSILPADYAEPAFSGVRAKRQDDGVTVYRAFRRGKLIVRVDLDAGEPPDAHDAWIAMLELSIGGFEPRRSQAPVLPIRTVREAPRVVRLSRRVAL